MHNRTIKTGAYLSTATSTTMTVLLLASIGQGWLSVGLLAAAGIGFELLKWSSWGDAWAAHYSHQQDKRNLMALLCTVAVILSIGASVATTRSNLDVSAGSYLKAREQRALLVEQIRQKQEAIDVCTAANRITLCARPLSAELEQLKQELNSLEIPAPDEATALILETANITGLSFDQAATLVVTVISVMLDASGLYFLYKQQEQSGVTLPVTRQEPAGGLSTHVYSDMNLSVRLGIDDLLNRALSCIQSGDVKPSVRHLSESLGLPQHTAQTVLHWLAEAGHLKRQKAGKGYMMPERTKEYL